MTPSPPCPECFRRGTHKMSCDTGYRLRAGGSVNLDEFTYTFDATPLLAMPTQDSGASSPPPCPPPAPPDTSYTCGGSE